VTTSPCDEFTWKRPNTEYNESFWLETLANTGPARAYRVTGPNRTFALESNRVPSLFI